MSLNCVFYVIRHLLRFNPFKLLLSFLFWVYFFMFCFLLCVFSDLYCFSYVYYCISLFLHLRTGIRTTATGSKPNFFKKNNDLIYIFQATDIAFSAHEGRREDKRVQQV
jgi:hypothetical protein